MGECGCGVVILIELAGLVGTEEMCIRDRSWITPYRTWIANKFRKIFHVK